MPIDINSDGLTRKLADLTERVQKRVVGKALRDAGQLMADAVEAATPVEVKYPGGTALLPDSIKPAITNRLRIGKNGYPQAVIKPKKDVAFVARWVEYGHRLVRGGRSALNRKRTGLVGKGSQVGDVAPEPFIRPTFEAEAQAAIEKFRTTFCDEMKKRS